KESTYYRPEHFGSCIDNGRRSTVDEDTRAVVGDYILVIAPRPDSLDDHHLHTVELVSNIERKGVMSNKSNDIKQTEYYVMTSGLLDNANIIDRLEQEIPEETAVDESTEQSYNAIVAPMVGQLYQKNDSDPILQAMVVAIEGRTVYLGTDIKVQIEELTDTDKWTLVLNVFE